MPSSPQDRDAPDRVVPLCAPTIVGREWQYVKDCLDTGWVSSVGAYVDRFEREFAESTSMGSPSARITRGNRFVSVLIHSGT